MKLILLVILVLFSCTPNIQYLGVSHQETQNVDFFFDKKDVKEKYVVIGLISNEADTYNDIEDIKEAMIKKVKSVGGDAILFEAINNKNLSETHHLFMDGESDINFSTIFSDTEQGVEIKGKVIKYKKKA